MVTALIAILVALIFLAPVALAYFLCYQTARKTMEAMESHEHQDFAKKQKYISCPGVGGFWQTEYHCNICHKEFIIATPQIYDSTSPL